MTDHVRIDEGVKRGPRKPRKPVPPKATKPTIFGTGKLSTTTPKSVIERYLAGENSTQIAATLNVTRQGLAFWMRKHAEEDWREAQIIQAVERKEEAEAELETAPDALSLARARERLRSAQWDLERVFSRIFGQKQEVTHTVAPILTINTAPVAIQQQTGNAAPLHPIIDVTPSK